MCTSTLSCIGACYPVSAPEVKKSAPKPFGEDAHLDIYWRRLMQHLLSTGMRIYLLVDDEVGIWRTPSNLAPTRLAWGITADLWRIPSDPTATDGGWGDLLRICEDAYSHTQLGWFRRIIADLCRLPTNPRPNVAVLVGNYSRIYDEWQRQCWHEVYGSN